MRLERPDSPIGGQDAFGQADRPLFTFSEQKWSPEPMAREPNRDGRGFGDGGGAESDRGARGGKTYSSLMTSG